MNNYEAIKKLAPEKLEKFLDQVFLTGFNIGYQSIIDPDMYDINPFCLNWLKSEIEESITLVEDENGDELIIKPLADVILRIIDFNKKAIPDDINWKMRVVLPKNIKESEEHGGEN